MPDLIRYLRVPISLATTDLQTAGIMPGLSQSTTLIKSPDLTRTIPLTHTRTRPHLAHPGGQCGEGHGSNKKNEGKKSKISGLGSFLYPRTTVAQGRSCSDSCSQHVAGLHCRHLMACFMASLQPTLVLQHQPKGFGTRGLHRSERWICKETSGHR